MREGLLWFDNDPKHKLADKVGQAAARYQVRFGRRPTLCYLNERDFAGETEEMNGIRLRPAPYVRPHHLWIGVEPDSVTSKAA
ncbi:MAG: hypothetical protein U0401_02575 [Anaerolineae bacterium]